MSSSKELFDEIFSEGEGGAPISPPPAGDIDRTVGKGKIHFDPPVTPTPPEKKLEKSKFILPPIVTRMSDEEFNRRKGAGVSSNNGKMSQVVDWRPDWSNPKKPRLKGVEANRAEIHAIEEVMHASRPPVREDWVLPDSGIPAEMLEEIFTYIAGGGTFAKYCEKTHLPCDRFWRLLTRDPEVKRRYQEARRAGVDAMADEALRIASEPAWQDDVVVTYDETGAMRQKAVKRYDNVYARKLAFQARQWMLAKLAPEKYGEKPQTGDTDSRAAKILAARKRLAAEVRASQGGLKPAVETDDGAVNAAAG